MRRPTAAALTLLLFSCARPPAEPELEPDPAIPPPALASLSVEVWRGFTDSPEIRAPGPPHLELVVDLSRSMRSASGDGPLYLYGAREAAATLVESLPDEATLDVHVLGVARGSTCGDTTRVASGEVAPLRELLAGKLRRLLPSGEGSLAEAVAAIAAERVDAVQEARVVVFTDLDDRCGGDLCAAAEALVASRARLELVVFGPAQAPACLAELTAPPSPWVADLEPPMSPPFQIVAAGSGNVVIQGRADGEPVPVPAGPAVLRLETEPPVELGPLDLEPGTHSRVRLLDFPTLEPPVREWRLNVAPMPSPPTIETRGETP
jgi:hypothetical protein